MKLYHVSPQHYVETIQAEGLDPEKCREPKGRVWFYVDEKQAKLHAGFGYEHASAVWVADSVELREEGIETRWNTPWDDRACYVEQIVSPELLTRL